MRFKYLIFSMLAIFSLEVLGHEGHSETSLKSIHGGIVKKTSNTFIEVVQEDGKTEVYVTGHDYKNIVDQKLGLKANAEVKGKKLVLELAVVQDHYLLLTDLKKEKHFKLNVLLNISGKQEKASFALENQ